MLMDERQGVQRIALAQRLRKLRTTELGREVKLDAVANATGSKRSSVWEWEQGHHIPREQALKKLSRFFAQGDSERAQQLVGELLVLRSAAIEELHEEGVRASPHRARPGRRVGTRLRTLDPSLIRECARLFDIDYLDACDEVLRQIQMHEPGSASRGRRQVPGSSIREALTSYYDEARLASGGLSPYQIEVNGQPWQLAVATTQDWVGLCIPLARIGATAATERCNVVRRPTAEGDLDGFRAQALRFLSGVETEGIDIYDAPFYRLMGMRADAGSLDTEISLDSFVRYRFTVGLLADELYEALLRARHPSHVAKHRTHWLPLRSRYLSDGVALADFPGRICAGGVLALVAFARGRPHDDYILALQRRGATVSDAPGLLSVIPKAFHGPSVLPHEQGRRAEAAASATLYRELFEELLGGREAEIGERDLTPFWYVQKSRPLR
jgi:transcriptional regulator with XRE-family HTH domain